jgi:hypothetical protein
MLRKGELAKLVALTTQWTEQLEVVIASTKVIARDNP